MTNVVKLSILLCFQYVLVQSIVPSLNVRRVDKTAVAKKRQDTLDMCRIFNDETVRVNNIHSPIDIIKSYARPRLGRNRLKRSLKYANNPALDKQDEQRVEEIVDKLYDDVDDYQKAKISKGKPKPPSRRFDFAPQLMQGPGEANKANYTDAEPPSFISKGRWKHGVIPYFIDAKTYDAQLAEQIMKAFDYVEKATCIRLQKLREKPVDEDSMTKVNWVYITNPTGIRQCVHSNENRPLDGVQMTVLGYDCMTQGDIVHEVMHILGYTHEHLRSDRDQYISVIWDNIKPGYRKYFDIDGILPNSYDLESLPYDYASIMHYPARAFSKNGQPTIIVENGVKIGQREGLSEIDLEKVGLIYSAECVDRNREYLLKTCPSVVKANIQPTNITQETIEDYFRDRLWPYGVIPYKFRDNIEFSAEERENMRAVFRHIEKETCILFRDMGAEDENNEIDDENNDINRDNHWRHVEELTGEIAPGTNNRTKLIGTKNIKLANEDNEETTTEAPTTFDVGFSIDITLQEGDKKKNKPKPNKGGGGGKGGGKGFGKGRGKKRGSKMNLMSVLTSMRRHAGASLTLTRSTKPGCQCPNPGKPKGDVVLQVNADCFNSVNDLLHYFVHILGLDHQHNMHDRDSYLQIAWNNLNDELKKDLENKLPPAASLGFAYDYQSVMHYPWLEIKNGKTNIMYPIWNDGWSMGHWQGLSSTDVQKLNLLYFQQCSERNKEGSL